MFAIKGVKIFPHRPAGLLGLRPVDRRSLDPLETAGVGLDHAGVHGKALTADKAGVHAAPNNAFEHPAKDLTVPEAAMAVHRKARMVRHPVLKPQPAEPSVG